MKRTPRLLFTIVLLTLLVVVTSCGNNQENNGGNNNNSNKNKENNNEEKQKEEAEDITIKWMYPWGEDRFMELMGDDIMAQFPHIKIEVLDGNADHPESIEDLIAAKNIPDIITTGQTKQISVLDEYDLSYNLDELIEKTGFDLDRIEPTIIEYTRRLDPNMENGLYAIPHSRPTWSLLYDKDVFDLLGENYPEDGMTWDEVVDLARNLTREVNGVQYRGLDLDIDDSAYTQFSQNSIDPETNEVHISDSEAYRKYLELVKEVVEIPGNYSDDTPLRHWGGELGKGDIAMTPIRTNWGALQDNESFDIVTYPVWEGYEGINPEPNGASWMITKQSENKEELLEIIDYLLSDEVQMEFSKKGDVEGGASVLVNPEVHKAFAEYNDKLANKNLESLFKYEYAVGPEKRSKYTDEVLSSAPIELIETGKDINEFLRVIQEEAEENVRSQMESE